MLLESPLVIAELLASVAHPVRVRVLAILHAKEQGLSDLICETGLSKNAMINHLGLMMETGLVDRVSRGKYKLTTDGHELADAVTDVYRNSVRREEERREQVMKLYAKGMMKGDRMDKKEIDKKVEYQPCWLSYTGAVAGSLKALGTECDVVDIGGQSGYSFMINVFKDTTCPSGPTALSDEVWDMIYKGTETLGWKMEHWFDNHPYPMKEGAPTPEELAKVKKLFEKVKREITEKDRPVVLWGLVVPEYGIVKGYQGDSYLVSTFRRLSQPGKPEDPIAFHELKAPGCLDAYFFKDKMKLDKQKVYKQSIERAVKFATASVPVHNKYVAGPTALDEWANQLENLPDEKLLYMGNSYVGNCVAEGRMMSAEFLKRLAKRQRGKQSKHLLEAAKFYEQGAGLMDSFTKIFPFRQQGEIRPEDRKKGAEILRKVKPLEEKAIESMKKALKEWG